MSGMSDRTRLLIGDNAVERLNSARVAVCGCGAVGGYVLEGLVRAGVGHILAVDGDVFAESNLNRQVLATTETIGRRKIDVACERARSISPGIDIRGMDVLISEETIPVVIDYDPDIIMDAIDTIGMKTKLLHKACELGIPVFSSMGAALHIDVTAIHVANVMDTSICPMAAKVRRALRGVDVSRVTCVYSTERPIAVSAGRDGCGKSVLGSMPTVPAIFGMMLVNEAVRYIIDL